MNGKGILFALGALFLLSNTSKAKTMPASGSGARGCRNNNPGNIRKSGDVFKGEILPSTDPAFKQFSSILYGYRAIFKILNTGLSQGENTIRKIITAYAPPQDYNNTELYIKRVSEATGIPENYIVSYNKPYDMINIVKAISEVENGVPANMDAVYGGYNLFKQG